MTTPQDDLPGDGQSEYRRARLRSDAELPWPMRSLVLARDGYACVCCSRPVLGQPYAIHLRKPGSLGGDTSPENLITVLGACGERISSRRDPADVDSGYTVRPGQDPALVPVVFTTPAGRMQVWLLPDGGRSFEPPAEGAAA